MWAHGIPAPMFSSCDMSIRERQEDARLLAHTGHRGRVRQAREHFGLLGAGALGRAERGGCAGCGRTSPGPGEMHHNEEPEECQQDEWS
jgi:hypothetical protein